MDEAKDDHFRYGVAIDLIGELLVGGARADWVAEAEGWLRNGGSGALGADDGFADLLAAAPHEEETLKTHVAACGLAVAISRYWMPVTAFQVRQELGRKLINGLPLRRAS